MEETAQKKLLLISISFLIIAAAGAWWFFQKEDYVISDVPFITIYNHTGKNAYLVTSMAAALVSVLEYHGTEFSNAEYQKINEAFFDPEDLGKLYGLDVLKNYAEKLGYATTIGTVESLSDLKKYINPTTNTPLIIGHLLEDTQNPLVRQAPFGVLIGVLEKEDAVILHDYYWGYNKKINWEEFKKMASTEYLVIQPKDQTIEHKKIPYLERTASMDTVQPLIDKITLGRVAMTQQQRKIALDYFVAVTKDKNFASVPPYYKLVAYNGVAWGNLMVKKDLDNALRFALRAKELNHDLDKPFGDYWPGFEDRTNTIINEYSGSYSVLGRIYEARKELALAKEAYQKAIDIWSANVIARDALDALTKGQ